MSFFLFLGIGLLILPVIVVPYLPIKDFSLLVNYLFLYTIFYPLACISISIFTNNFFAKVEFDNKDMHIYYAKQLFPFFLSKRTILYENIEEIWYIKNKGKYIFTIKYLRGKKSHYIYPPIIKNDEYNKKFFSLGRTMTDKSKKIDPEEKTFYRKFTKIVINLLLVVSILGTIAMGLTVPAEELRLNTAAGAECTALIMCIFIVVGRIPVLGQILIYKYGRVVISFLFNLFKISDISWNPNYLISVDIKLSDLIFIPVFILSVFVSIDEILMWIKRRKLATVNKK